MFALVEMESNVRVPPTLIGKDIKDSIEESIKEQFEGKTENNMILLELIKIDKIGEGKIIPEDGGVYHRTIFTMLAFEPKMQEIVEGKVVDITEFGAFVRIGPLDAMVHISQVMDDYITYSKAKSLHGKESKKSLKIGDIVRARIIAVNLNNPKGTKIQMTMRQPYLGKIEWIEKEVKKNAK